MKKLLTIIISMFIFSNVYADEYEKMIYVDCDKKINLFIFEPITIRGHHNIMGALNHKKYYSTGTNQGQCNIRNTKIKWTTKWAAYSHQRQGYPGLTVYVNGKLVIDNINTRLLSKLRINPYKEHFEFFITKVTSKIIGEINQDHYSYNGYGEVIVTNKIFEKFMK